MNEFLFICARLILDERVLKILSVTERHSIMSNMQACDIFRELSDRTTGEISKFTSYSIIWCMFYTKCHTIGDGRLTVCPR